MDLIDIGANLTHESFDHDRNAVLQRAREVGVVQQVAKEIGDVEVGTLATFDQMFAGIRASLKSAAQRSIDVAERNLDLQMASARLLQSRALRSTVAADEMPAVDVAAGYSRARNSAEGLSDPSGKGLAECQQPLKKWENTKPKKRPGLLRKCPLVGGGGGDS